MQRALRLCQRFTEPMQIAAVIILREEAWLAIVTALHDVQRNTIEVDAATPGHSGSKPSALS